MLEDFVTTFTPCKFFLFLYLSIFAYCFYVLSSVFLGTIEQNESLTIIVTLWLCIIPSATFVLYKVVIFKISVDQTKLKIGHKLSFQWCEISRIKATAGSGRYRGIRIYFKRNIYSDLPLWKRPIGKKEAYFRDFNIGLLYIEDSSELIEKIMLAKRKSC